MTVSIENREVVLAFDKSVRHYDTDGRLHVALTPISKATVNPYLGHEIPRSEELGLDPTRVYQLLRDPEELAKAAATSNNIPLMAKHIRQAPDDPQQDEVVGSTGTDATFDAPYLRNSLVVWVKSAIDAIENNSKRELSCSYHYDPDMTPGVYQGQAYDGVMRNLRFNHVALVEDGRAGSDVLVEDSLPPSLKETTMKSRKALLASGALIAYLTPKLAQDAQMPNIKKALAGTTAATWARQKSVIVSRLKDAMKDRLAKDASLEDMHGLLDSLDKADDDEPDEMDAQASDETPEEKAAREKKEAAAAAAEDEEAETEEEKAERMKRRQEAKDKAAKDKAAKDAEEDADKDKEPKVTKAAMDAAIASAKEVTKREMRDAAQALREAQEIVSPTLGKLACDSAEEVYRTLFKAENVDVTGVPATAFKALAQQTIRAAKRTTEAPVRLAHDASAAKSFNDRFPGAGRVRAV